MATDFATASASPVIMTTVTPRACSASIAARDSGRTSSASASAPITVPPAKTCRMIAPSSRHRSATVSSVACSCSSSAGPPTWIVVPSTSADTPIAGDDWKSVAAGTVRFRVRAASMMARARGCSESASAAEARPRTSSAVCPSVTSTPVTVGSPLVRVPVLSNSTVSTVRMVSSANRSLTRTPPRAARSVAMDTTSGIARPSACGQAMTNTVIVRMTASSGIPNSVHTAAVMIADPRANQNNHPAAVSAIR